MVLTVKIFVVSMFIDGKMMSLDEMMKVNLGDVAHLF